MAGKVDFGSRSLYMVVKDTPFSPGGIASTSGVSSITAWTIAHIPVYKIRSPIVVGVWAEKS